ncbi:unnamed protein product [Absidia cylindrospora]
MNFSCGCIFDKSVKEPHFKKSKHFEDLSASFAINAKNEKLGAHYSWLVQMHKIQVACYSIGKLYPQTKFPHPRYYVLTPDVGELNCGLYKMKLTAYSDKTRSKVLAEHENELLSRVNTDTCYKTEFMEKMNAAARQAEQDWEKRR